MKRFIALFILSLFILPVYAAPPRDERSPGVLPGGGAPGLIHSHVGTVNQLNIAGDGTAIVTFSTPQDTHTGAIPTFAGLTLSGLTASRLLASDGAKALASTSASSWVLGTAGQVVVTDNGDGTVTLSSPLVTGVWRIEATDNFFGPASAGASLTTGDYNVGGGADSLALLTTGSENVSYGYKNMPALVGAVYNTSVGNYGMELTDEGDENTTIGWGALKTNVTGSLNFAGGFEAGARANADSDSNVFVGHRAGPATLGEYNNTLWIDIDFSDAPLIYGDFSADTATINGILTVTDAINGGTILTSAETTVDLTVATYLLDLDFTDDGDAEGNFLRCRDNSAGDVKFLLGANGFIDITPNGITGTGNQVLEITPADALPASAHLTMIRLVGDSLDPSGASTRICGLAVKLDDVLLGNDPEINAIRVVMPATYTGQQDMAAFYASGNGHVIEFMDNDKGRNSIWTDGEIEQDYTAASTTHTTFSPIQVNLDVDDLAATSDIHAIGVSVTGTTTGTYAAVGTNGTVDVIHQHIGAFVIPDQAEYAARFPNGGAWTDGIDGNQCFVAVSDEIYIGSATKFSQLEVLLTTLSSKEIRPEFYFYDTSPVWVQFGPTDGSGGFTSDGIISWDSAALTNWNGAYDPAAGDSSTGYYIKIKRTRVVVATPPTPATVKILEPTLYDWDEDGDLNINDITVNGITTFTTSASQAITGVGNTILANATRIELNPDANYTLTSTPHIADGTKGDILIITAANGEANSVTLQDQDTLGGSNVELGATTRAVTGKTVLVLAFDGSDWIEVNYGATGLGDILKDLVAGNGLTGGADDVFSGVDSDVTVTVGAGDGLIVNADEVEVYGLVASDGDPTDAVTVAADGDTTIKYALVLPQANAPTTDAEGEIAWDDNDDALEVYDGSVSRLIASLGDGEVTIFAPDGVNDQIPIFHVDADKYPHGIKLVNVQITIPSDGAYSMVFEEWAGDPAAAQNDIETVTTGAGDSYMEVTLTDIDDSDIDADDYIFLDIPATDIDWIQCKFIYYIKEGN